MPSAKKPPKHTSSLGYIVIIALIFTLFYAFFNPNPTAPEKVTLDTFFSDINTGIVEEISVEDNKVYYTTTGEAQFYTIKEPSETLTELLADIDESKLDKVQIEIVDTTAGNFWFEILISFIPFLLIIGFFLFMMRQATSSNNQAMSFGKSQARLQDPEKKKKNTFKDVAGAEEAKEELVEIVDFLKNPAKYTSMGAKIPKGVILVGQPGTGKTLLARAVAGEADVPFFNISGSEFVEMFVGVGASVTGDTPVLIRENGCYPRLAPISEVVDPNYNEGKSDFAVKTYDLETLGYNPEETGFRGCSKKSKHKFFGNSSWQKVSAVYRHKTDKIYKIHFRGGVIKTTGDHSIFVRSRNTIISRKASELKEGDLLVNLPFKVRGKFIPGVGTTHKVKAHQFEEEPRLKELRINENENEEYRYAYAMEMKGHFAQKTIAQTLEVSQSTISNWQIGKHETQTLSTKGHTKIPGKVAVTTDLMKLFGLYTAEGCANGRLEFILGTHEQELIEECTALMYKVFGLYPKIRNTEDNSTRITYYSAPLGRFFEKHCGNGSKNKHIPPFMWEMPKEYFLSYLKGYTDGDGYTTKDGKLSASSVSKQLILELCWLLSMHGIQSGIREGENQEGRIIKDRPIKGGKYWNLIIGKTSHPFIESESSPFQFKKPKITKIEIEDYNGYVYDLCGCHNEAFFGGEKPLLLHNSRVRDLFKKAKRNAPCIIFIDEIDAVGRHRGAGMGGGHDEREQTLNQILTEMDGFEQNTNVIIFSATNRPDVLDPALLRPGRFDRRVMIDLPDIDDREGILKIHTKNKPLAKLVDLNKIARQTPGFSGADLENLANEAAILAAKNNKKTVSQKDLEHSIEKVLMGPERKSRVLSKDEKKITAYHETGHAIVGHFLPECDPIHKVSIISRGMALGITWFLPEEDKHLYSSTKFEHELASLLGGYAAEKLIFGEVSTGPSNDLERATKMARKMVTKYGMSELGPTIFGQENEEIFLGKDFGHVRNYSEEVASKIDSTVDRIVKKAYTTALELIKKNEKKLHKIAEELMKKETLTREEFLKFFKTKK